MARIISASIDLTKLDKSKITPGEKGQKFYNIDIFVNDKPNEYKQDVGIREPQTKEQRTKKEKAVYLGNGKTVWTDEKTDIQPEKQAKVQDDLVF